MESLHPQEEVQQSMWFYTLQVWRCDLLIDWLWSIWSGSVDQSISGLHLFLGYRLIYTVTVNVRHLKGEDLTSLHPKELIHIEEALENGLTGVRDKQVSSTNLFSFGRKGIKLKSMYHVIKVMIPFNVFFSDANCNIVCLLFIYLFIVCVFLSLLSCEWYPKIT